MSDQLHTIRVFLIDSASNSPLQYTRMETRQANAPTNLYIASTNSPAQTHSAAEAPPQAENITNESTEHSNTQKSESQSHIVLPPEKIFTIGPLPVTNTLVTSWLVMAVIITISFLATKNIKRIPSGIQNFVELIVEGMYSLTKDLAHEKTKYFFPIVMTFFLFILTANLFGLLPGVMTLTTTINEHKIPILRPMNTDLNMTLALSMISLALTHYYAVKFLGIGGYLKKWFSFNLILLFVGLLELVSEFTKMISLSFRLFGNIFAGEIVLTTVSGLFAFFAPLPFYLLEVLVGVVQAAVFMMLTLVFMTVLSEKHEAH